MNYVQLGFKCQPHREVCLAQKTLTESVGLARAVGLVGSGVTDGQGSSFRIVRLAQGIRVRDNVLGLPAL